MKSYLFQVGQVVATPAVLEHCTPEELVALLDRHMSGDWGSVPPEDAAENRRSVQHGYRILSAYEIRGETIWLITEADRSSSCYLFPSEY